MNKGKHQKPSEKYTPPKPTPIEQIFLDAAKSKINGLEREQWFGDEQQQYRYRVDFLVKSKKLAIELDGRGSHLTEEQRANDAKKQRYLERSGYRVIRFTGAEITKDADQCVREVISYLDGLEDQRLYHQVIYIDRIFLDQQITQCKSLYKALYHSKSLQTPSFEELVKHMIDWLHFTTSDIEVYIFQPKVDEVFVDTFGLHDKVQWYKESRIRYQVYECEWIAFEILEHLKYHARYYDRFVLVADDLLYTDFLTWVDSNKLAYLLRRDNDSTRMLGHGLGELRWQNVQYIIGSAMGLKTYEL